MKTDNLNNYIRGWIVGSFTKSLYSKDYEIGIKEYKSGNKERSHAHFLSEEVTVVLSGKVKMNGAEYSSGEIIIQEKGEYTDFECLEDCITLIYRPDGSFPNDKFFKEE